MSNDVFHWIGVVFVAAIGIAVVGASLGAFYALFIHRRFNAILFRKSERRLSIASWSNAKLMNDEHFHADDWPIGKRPFYLSYELRNQRRFFVMLGVLEPRRDMPISGKHPNKVPKP